ncbi:MAG TPA: hypothetical protein VGF06_07535 [Terriglobales bacterium]|jgi:hypothetical protein
MLLSQAFAADDPSATEIINRSVKANMNDWSAAPGYDHCERVKNKDGSKTFAVIMLLGSPYRRLTLVNGKPLSQRDEQREARQFKEAVAKRRAESPAGRKARIAKYDESRSRDHEMLAQMTKAFDFKRVGKGELDGHEVFVLAATPRPGYQPPTANAQALTGMAGKLWVDTAGFQWVKVQAAVKRPVSIHGFLATVEPGTRFELEKTPVSGGMWLPRHFSVRAHAQVLFIFSHDRQEDDTFFNYTKSTGDLDDHLTCAEPSGN